MKKEKFGNLENKEYCYSCKNFVSKTEIYISETCGHKFCMECLKEIINKIDLSEKYVKCFYDYCGNLLTI